MTITAQRRQMLLDRKALLEKGALNWTDEEIAYIATFTPIPEADLRVMRHKMQRAAEFSIRSMQALDDLVRASPDPTRLRKRLERTSTIQQGIEKLATFTGMFARVKEQVERIDAELARR